MKEVSDNIVLESIGIIFEKSENCKLDPEFFDSIKKELKTLSEYFAVSDVQAFLIANVFIMSFKENTVEIGGLINYFACNPVKLTVLFNDFESLYLRGIFKRTKLPSKLKSKYLYETFVLNDNIIDSILNNVPLAFNEEEPVKNEIELLERLYSLSEKRDKQEISTAELLSKSKEMLNLYKQFPLIKCVKKMKLNDEENYFYLILIWRTISGKHSTYLVKMTQRIFDKASSRVSFVQQIVSKRSELLKQQLIDIEERTFFNDTELTLSTSSSKLLQKVGITLYNKNIKQENIILPEKIKFKKLIYNEEEKEDITLLQSVLHDEKLKEVQNRLTSKRLPTGITVLLHGDAGTGKTETVFQLAKETGREIIKIEISQSKSMWFGESEKLIKRIFSEYKDYAKDCVLKPILFFNEADAIISKRKDTSISSVAQTENAIQNILLEELENFDGIFIATTNLIKNMDCAFERRFLFKIEFRKPCFDVKTKIWQTKLPDLSGKECETLSEVFDFSGAQIENIVRKNEMFEITHGIDVDFSNILFFCEKELLNKKKTASIGF